MLKAAREWCKIYQFLHDVISAGVRFLVIIGVMLFRRWKCSLLSTFWYGKWIGEGTRYNPNACYMHIQASRPVAVLLEFIQKKKLEELSTGEWQYHQYMVYLAKILENGNYHYLRVLNTNAIVECCCLPFAQHWDLLFFNAGSESAVAALFDVGIGSKSRLK